MYVYTYVIVCDCVCVSSTKIHAYLKAFGGAGQRWESNGKTMVL